MSTKQYNYNASVLESDLYECPTEDGIGITFDCQVVADVSVGGTVKTYIHKTFLALGAGADDDGVPHVLRSRDEALEFAAKVNAKGVIDLAHWDEFDANAGPSLEERFSTYAQQEDAERHGRAA